MGTASIFWTDERVDQLKSLHAQSYSFTDIGTKIGCSRNSAIGKAHRLGLTEPKVKRAKHVPQRKPIVRIVRMNGNSDKMRVVESVTGVPYVCHEAKVEPLHISFDELTVGTCHYPHGDIPDMTFCGRQTIAGSSYCGSCHRLCWRKSEPPKPRYVREAA